MEDDKLYCPNCGSSQLVANKKGFGAGKALTGAVLTGGIGLLAGFVGSGKVKVTCLRCGRKWEPGELRTTPLPPETKSESNNKEDDGCATALVGVVFIVLLILIALL